MAEWTTAEVNDLPDSAFLFIAPGGDKDADGKTTPRSLRHFPYRNASGKIDLPHLRNAIARIPQADIPSDKKRELQAHAEKLLEKANEDRGDARDVRPIERGVYRLDLAVGSLKERQRTPQGGLIAPANLTRVGVFPYRMADGSTRMELRPPEEVFRPDSIATYGHAPVTIDHPGKVGPNNWKQHAVGTVGHEVRQNGNFLSGDLRIQHADAIERAEKGDLHDVSCGYTCDFDPTPGQWNGIPYDGVQRNIRINHVAVGPKGWGRMGTETAMRLDAADSAIGLEAAREDAPAIPHVVVAHAADGSKTVAKHPSQRAALEAAKAHRASGGKASVFSEQDYKRTQDRSYELSSPGAATEYANQATLAAKTPEEHRAAAAAHNEAANAYYAVGATASGNMHAEKAREHENSAAGAHIASAMRGLTATSDAGASAPHYFRGDSTEITDMGDQNKDLEKAKSDLESANKALEKARQDAKDATDEKSKLEAKAREDAAKIAQLTAELALAKAQSAQPSAEEKARADAKAEAEAEARVIERQALVADARMVFASATDPQGSRWKAEGADGKPKTADAIRREVLAELSPTVKLDSIDKLTDGLTGDALASARGLQSQALKAVYDQAIALKRDQDKARARLDGTANGPRMGGAGGAGDDETGPDGEPLDAEKARRDMVKRIKNDWKIPKKDRAEQRMKRALGTA